MEREDIKKIIKTIYGSYTVNWSKEQIEHYIAVWAKELNGIPANIAFDCLKRHIREKPTMPRICHFWEYYKSVPRELAEQNEQKEQAEKELALDFNKGWELFLRLPVENKKEVIRRVKRKTATKLGSLAWFNLVQENGEKKALSQSIAIMCFQRIDKLEKFKTDDKVNFDYYEYWQEGK